MPKTTAGASIRILFIIFVLTVSICAIRAPSSLAAVQDMAASPVDLGVRPAADSGSRPTQREPVPPLLTPTLIFSKTSSPEAGRLAQSLDKFGQGLTSWKDLAPALAVSRSYAESWPPDEPAFEHSGMGVTWRKVLQSLNLLEKTLPELDKNPNLLAERFEWLRVTPGPRFTAYYSPVVKASLTRAAGFEHPLYRLPEAIAPELAWCLPTHTCPEEPFTRVIAPDTPYYGRAEIDLDQVLRGKKLEMAYVSHPFDAYLLMLEGSGILEFTDGSRRAVLFAGLSRKSDGKSSSMAGYLMRTGQVARKNANMEGMRAWWDTAAPQKRRALLEACPTYVFFRFGAPEPRGTAGGPLTPWVSMATDPRVLPLGGIVAYKLPSAGKIGLGLAHDTGGAIKMRRIDMYTGSGDAAGVEAHRVNHHGETWLLLAK